MHTLDFQKLDLMDALDTAILIEEEAVERYEEFVRAIGTVRPGDAGDVFMTMAKAEAQHERELRERRKKLFGDAPARVDRTMIWDIEAPDHWTPRAFMSKAQAMHVALSGEIKAYDFFDRALKAITDKNVRELFTELRQEEVQHQNLLKQWLASNQGEQSADRNPDEVEEPDGL